MSASVQPVGIVGGCPSVTSFEKITVESTSVTEDVGYLQEVDSHEGRIGQAALGSPITMPGGIRQVQLGPPKVSNGGTIQKSVGIAQTTDEEQMPESRRRREGEVGLLKGSVGGCHLGMKCCVCPIFYPKMDMGKHNFKCEACGRYFRPLRMNSEHRWKISRTSRPIDAGGDPAGPPATNRFRHPGGRGDTEIDGVVEGTETVSIILELDVPVTVGPIDEAKMVRVGRH